MNAALGDLIAAIASGRLLRPEDLALLDVDELLTRREMAAFDTAWAQAFEAMSTHPSHARHGG